MSEIIIIEISSVKNISKIADNLDIIINPFHRDMYWFNKNTLEIINENEFIIYLNLVIEILKKYNKKYLFVSHFNYCNIKNREIIINLLKNNLPEKNFFDPSQIVIDNLPNSLIDEAHYSKEFEVNIMNKLHECISQL